MGMGSVPKRAPFMQSVGMIRFPSLTAPDGAACAACAREVNPA
jgi:hypothetical protein